MIIENFFLAILIILIVLVTGLIFQNFKLKKRLDLFFKRDDTNFEEFLVKQVRKIEKQEADLKKIFEEISKLNKISQSSLQKIGVVRYNPFKDVGGNQSFSIALLDLNNNGFVITSLYSREGNRVYAKPIKNGKPEYLLSEEEIEAIKRAQGS